MNRYLFCTIILAALACGVAFLASAVIQEVTLKGAIATVNAPKNTLTIENPLQYGCNYPTSGSPICTYSHEYLGPYGDSTGPGCVLDF